MKLFFVIALATTLGIYSSGREPGAAMPDTTEAVEQFEVGGSGLPPRAMVYCIAEPNAETSFLTIDITIDPKGQPLGAYQFELTSPDASFKVVGVESGEHPAFDHGRPPYFDPVAQQGKTDRLILAEYALPSFDADKLPTQAVRVATVHVLYTGQLDDNAQPAIQLTLTTAGDAAGNRIDALVRHTFRTPERPE